MSQEVPSSIKESLQQQLQEVEQRRNDLLPEHQRVQKRSQKIQSIQDKRKNMQKETAATREDMRKIRKEIMQKKERFHLLLDRAAKHEMAEAEMEAELQGLQAGEERRGSNASQTVDCGSETMFEQILAMGTKKAGFHEARMSLRVVASQERSLRWR